MLDLAAVDLSMLAEALSDNGDDGEWLFDVRTGELSRWAIWEGDAPDEDDGDDLLVVGPVPNWVWYQDMVDFTDQVTNEQARRRLARALDGRGAFRRFRNEIHDEHPELLGAWNAFRRAREGVRAVEWLWENDLVDHATLDRFKADHPDPAVP